MKHSINNFNADEKIMQYMDKLDYFFNGHKTLIVTELDLTNRCNNRCPGGAVPASGGPDRGGYRGHGRERGDPVRRR